MKENRRNAIRMMWQLSRLLESLWKIMAIAVASGVLGFLLAFGISLFGAYAFLAVLSGTNLSQIPFGTWSFSSYIIAMGVCAFSRGILHYLEQYCNHHIAFHILAELRVKLFQKMRVLAPAKVDGENQGNLISMITGDIELLEVFYAHTVSPVFIAMLTSVFLFVYNFHLHWFYALYAFLGQAFIAIVIPYLASQKSKRLGMQVRNEMGSLNGEFLDKLRGLREVLQYGQGRKMTKRIVEITEELSEKQGELRKQMAFVQTWTDSAILFFSICHLLCSFFLVQKALVSMEVAVLAGVLEIGSFAPFINLANLGNILAGTFASGERVLSLLEESPVVVEKEGAEEISFGDLEVEALSFAYEKDGKEQTVLEEINLRIEPGEILGIMGASGCGKSSLLKLMLRFWDPQSGTIRLGGKDIRVAKRNSLYSHYNYMTQTTSLFTGTLRENLLLAKEDATEEEIALALKKASFYDYVMSLENKLETIVEEGGKNFSGGERQRIGLARCFLANRPIFFLDEPTSNLDVQNEAIVLKSLLEHREGKTIVLVSHRLSTLGICDRILKMEKGRFVKA